MLKMFNIYLQLFSKTKLKLYIQSDVQLRKQSDGPSSSYGLRALLQMVKSLN